MEYWCFSIAADQEGPELGSGQVRAESVEDALALVGHPETNLYLLPDGLTWPASAESQIVWTQPLKSVDP